MPENKEKVQIENLPLISVVIPARNEERYIPKCLDSILSQDYPPEKIEIIVVDGISTDKTVEIASSYAQRYSRIKILANPKKITPAGLNIGVREAQGEIIARVDSHGWLEKDYLSKCLSYLTKSGVQNVGGPVTHIGENLLGQTIALASRTRSGLGGAKFRRSRKEEFVDTVFPGFFWKKTIEDLGYFDENLPRNQDIAFNYKIRRNRGKILLTPAIKVCYYTRPTISSLWKQNFTTGYWNIRTLIKYPGSLSLRHFVPLLFIGSLTVSSLLAIIIPLVYLVPTAILISYLIFALLSSLSITYKKGAIYSLVLFIVFPIIHFSYGFGSIWGIISLLWRGAKR